MKTRHFFRILIGFFCLTLVGRCLLANCDQPEATCTFDPNTDFEINVNEDCSIHSGGDDTDLVQAAINTGLPVVIPPGLYNVDDTLGDGDLDVICLKSGTHLRGAGMDVTVLKLGSRGGHILSGNDVTNVSITDLTLEGNLNQSLSGTHGIRLGNATNVRIRNVMIRETRGYGIGLQDIDGAGAFEDVIITGVTIENVGSDGIDIKNRSNGNRSIIISDITVVRPGVLDPTNAGIDVRGPVTLSNIHVRDLRDSQRGIRFRQGETTSNNGLGAHQASLTNFWISAGSNPGSGTWGVSILARDVSVSNGYIEDVQNGVVITTVCTGDPPACDGRMNTRLVNVTVRNAGDTGFVIGEDVDSVRCTGCSAIDSGTEGFRINGLNTFLSSCLATGSVEAGVNITSLSSGTLLVDCDVRGNYVGPLTGSNVTLSSAAARVRNTLGFCQTGDSDCWTIP